MKILLLQARYEDDPARAEEVETFAAACGLAADAFVAHDLLAGPPSRSQLAATDVLMVGGSGDFYLSQGDLPNLDDTLAFLREVVASGYPTFASCFGYQCLVLALGGELVFDPENAEVGTFDLRPTPAAADDELFGLLPSPFAAQLGHKDRASRPPVGTVNLASSERCAHQALRVPGKPIWATQFHPELDRKTNYGRFQRYLDGYAAELSPEELDRAHLRFRDSPDTALLLPRFLELVRGGARNDV
ncbi:MAG: type 1 glutamine amidotransferase [Thermoanaerobaculia bacterium]|nr:type 1 glutamine amidotransferase [Thermoanaerobaculia bacterium]